AAPRAPWAAWPRAGSASGPARGRAGLGLSVRWFHSSRCSPVVINSGRRVLRPPLVVTVDFGWPGCFTLHVSDFSFGDKLVECRHIASALVISARSGRPAHAGRGPWIPARRPAAPSGW